MFYGKPQCRVVRTNGRTAPELGSDAAEILEQYRWPGNVRELRNVLERALLFCKTGVLDRDALRFDRSLEPESGVMRVADDDAQTLDDAERRHIAAVLGRAGGKVDDAARVLALSRSSLYAKLKKYGLRAAGG